MSIENPYRTPETLPADFDPAFDRDRLRRIATAQRQVNIAVLLYLGLIPMNIVLAGVGGAQAWAGIFLGLYLLVVLVLGVFSIFRLAAIYRGNVVAFLYVIGLLVPLLGLLLLLSISNKATKELRKAGVRVGILGADPKLI